MFKTLKTLKGVNQNPPLPHAITLEEFLELPHGTIYTTNYKQAAALARALNKRGITNPYGSTFDTYNIPNYYNRIEIYHPYDDFQYTAKKEDKEFIHTLRTTGQPELLQHPNKPRQTFLFEEVNIGFLPSCLTSIEEFFTLPQYANIHCSDKCQTTYLLEVLNHLGKTWRGGHPINKDFEPLKSFKNLDFYFFNDYRRGIRERNLISKLKPKGWALKVSDRNCTSFEFDEVDFSIPPKTTEETLKQ